MLVTYILLFTVALDVPAVRQYLKPLIDYVNSISAKMESLELICYTIIGTLIVMYLKELFFKSNDVDDTGFIQQFLKLMRHLPMLEKTVAKKMDSVNRQVEDELRKGLEDKKYLHTLPLKGWSPDEILKAVEEYKNFGKYSWKDGYVSGAVYHDNDKKFLKMIKDVYGETSYTNPLHSDIFPGIRIMEGEIVRMICNLFNGDSQACGTVTTGGTESIFLACKAYRDYARNSKDIQYPNMVIPVTAHAAFDKAAHMLRIKVKRVPVDPESTKVNIGALRKAIDRNTCMLVASAPAFPHGGIDPVEAIADIGYYYKIPVHVDCCLGGFLLPFMGKAGFKVPPFDFSIPGVTSISADTHKYAYAPKGSSVVLYRDKEYRHYQFSVQPDWPGGIYGTPNLSGSRAGGIIATCWASLLFHGEETYIECTKKIISTAKYIAKGLKEIPGLFVFGEPEVSVIAVGSDDFDIYRLSGALTAQKNWSLNVLQFPSGFHICVTLQHTQDGVADRFLDDVRECTLEIMKEPHLRAEGSAAIYGMAQAISDRSLVSEIVWAFIDSCYNVENRDDDDDEDDDDDDDDTEKH